MIIFNASVVFGQFESNAHLLRNYFRSFFGNTFRIAGLTIFVVSNIIC